MKINPLKAEKLMEMNVFMQKLQIKQKACYIEQNGSGGPIILWGMYPHRGNEIAHMWDCLMETVNDLGFSFLCISGKDGMVIFLHGSYLLPSEMMISKEMVQRLYNG